MGRAATEAVGPAGPAGAVGPAGSPGAAGAPGLSTVTQIVTVPSNGTYTTTSGVGTNNIPSGWTPANGKQYLVVAKAWGIAGSGDRCSIVVSALVMRDGGTSYKGSNPTVGATDYTGADLAGALAGFNLSGGALRLGITGVALFALNWGCIFEITELPNA